jgi:hypothetical protein
VPYSSKKLFNKTYNEELKRLQEYEVVQNVHTDSEGLTYNSLKRKFDEGGHLVKTYILEDIEDKDSRSTYTEEELKNYIEDWNSNMETNYQDWKDFNKGEEYYKITPLSTFAGGGMTNEDILRSFLTSEKQTQTNNLATYYNEYDNQMLLRNYQTLIATRMGRRINITNVKHSVTTTKITNRLKALAEEMGYGVFYVSEFAQGGIAQDSWRKSGEGNLSIAETKKVAKKYAEGLTMSGEGIFTVNPKVEENSFDLDFNNEEYDGGSYIIYGDGSVVNMALNPSERYGSINSTPTQIKNKFIDIQKQYKNAEFKDLIRNDGSVYGKRMVSELKYVGGGGVDSDSYKKFGNDNAHLVNFDLSELDDFEEMQFNHISKSSSKADSLQVLINNVEGDYSQLSPTLSKIAEAQYPSDEFYEDNRQYAEGGLAKKRRRSASVQYGGSDRSVDKTRFAKPVGYRFTDEFAKKKRRVNHAIPKKEEIKQFLGNGIYKESRRNRSDRNRKVKL